MVKVIFWINVWPISNIYTCSDYTYTTVSVCIVLTIVNSWSWIISSIEQEKLSKLKFCLLLPVNMDRWMGSFIKHYPIHKVVTMFTDFNVVSIQPNDTSNFNITQDISTSVTTCISAIHIFKDVSIPQYSKLCFFPEF